MSTETAESCRQFLTEVVEDIYRMKMDETYKTLQFYEENAETFLAETLSADMSETRDRFLRYMPEKACILDFGCGSGRGTKAFLERG